MNEKLLIAIVIVIALLVGGIFLTNPGNRKTANPQTPQAVNIKTVEVNQNGFSPSEITVSKGETVKWVNKSGQDASVNSAPHPTHNLYRFLNLGEFPNGSSVQTEFQKEGSYDYHNHLNPSQQGTVIVK